MPGLNTQNITIIIMLYHLAFADNIADRRGSLLSCKPHFKIVNTSWLSPSSSLIFFLLIFCFHFMHWFFSPTGIASKEIFLKWIYWPYSEYYSGGAGESVVVWTWWMRLRCFGHLRKLEENRWQKCLYDWHQNEGRERKIT